MTNIGTKNNLLTVEARVYRKGRWHVVCLCDCGNKTTIRETFFKTGKTKSCGCISSRKLIEGLNRKRYGESARNSHFTSYRAHARKRDLIFELTQDQFESVTCQRCHYCGSPPKLLPYPKSYGEGYGNGVDRCNNDVGYVLWNCLPCCGTCNTMKGSLSYDEFVAACRHVADHSRYTMDFSTIWTNYDLTRT